MFYFTVEKNGKITYTSMLYWSYAECKNVADFIAIEDTTCKVTIHE